MSKFTFVCQEEPMPFYDIVSSKRTVEFDADSLNQIVSEFENFLRGCGFCFNGQLEFVDYDEPIEYQKMKMGFTRSELDNTQSSNFDFTDIPKNNWPFNKQQDDANAKITFASEK